MSEGKCTPSTGREMAIHIPRMAKNSLYLGASSISAIASAPAVVAWPDGNEP